MSFRCLLAQTRQKGLGEKTDDIPDFTTFWLAKRDVLTVWYEYLKLGICRELLLLILSKKFHFLAFSGNLSLSSWQIRIEYFIVFHFSQPLEEALL